MANLNRNCGKGTKYQDKRNATGSKKVTNGKRTTRSKGTRIRDDKPVEFTDTNEHANDPAWYSMTPELMADAGRIPFSWSVGAPFRTKNKLLTNQCVPGILSVELCPAYGWADSATDPLNIAAFELYSYVRHANSGSPNYDAPDLMLYVLAVSNACSYIEFLRRVYGVVNVYSQRNRYLPKALVEAMNVDFDSIHQNLADFRYGINVLINKLASFAAPTELTIFNRHAFLYSQVYTEGTSVKDQLYIYNPKGFGRYILTGNKFSDAPAGALALVPFDPGVLDTIVVDQNTPPTLSGKKFTAQDLINYGRMLMQPLLESEDLNIMSGDILKAYGADRIFKYAFIDENYTVTPTFDIGVLEQIKNAKFYRTALYNSTNVGNHSQAFKPYDGSYQRDANVGWYPLLVYQDLAGVNYGNLHSEWGYLDDPTRKEYATDYENVSNEKFMTTSTADVTPALIMESSRLMVSLVPEVQADINSKAVFHPYYCGSEVVTGFVVYQHIYDGNSLKLEKIIKFDMNSSVLNEEINTFASLANVIKRISTLRHFDFSPEITVFQATTPGVFPE